MPNFVHILLRILAGIAGALLLYVAFFLYEDEEARIQNRLEQIWKRIDALQNSAMSKEVAFLQGSASTCSKILDRLFGHELFSAHFAAVSIAFSFASYLLWLAVFVDRWSFAVVLCSTLMFAFGALPVTDEKRGETFRILGLVVKLKFYDVAAVVVSLILLGVGYDQINQGPLSSWGFEMSRLRSWSSFFDIGNYLLLVWTNLLIVGVFGIVFDMLFTIFFRWMLATISRSTTLLRILLCLSAVVVVSAVLVGPAVAVIVEPPFEALFWGETYAVYRANMTLAVFGCNFVDALCLLLLIAVMTCLVMHRLFWPLIKRPIYAANRKQLIKNTKLLGGIGTLLLMYAFHNHPAVKWLTEHLPWLRGG